VPGRTDLPVCPVEAGRHSLKLEFEAGGHRLEMPILLVRGAAPGRTLLVSAGVHGDEYEGIRAILETFGELDPAIMRGSFLAVPVASLPAYHARSRSSPLDGSNLARVFPGRPDGSPTEAIAWHFGNRILPLADLYLDLHSGGIAFAMPTLAGYYAGDPAAREAAYAFGAPVIWRHPTIAPGRTISEALSRGIPALYAEAGGGGRIHPNDLRIYRCGIVNLMRHLGILEGLPETEPPLAVLCGDGDIDRSVLAGSRGFLIPEVDLLDEVRQGQPLGRLLDFAGAVIKRYDAPCDGVVALIHALPQVEPGEPVFLVTGADR
jgi:uncharacterized protein